MSKPILTIVVPSYNVSKYVDLVVPYYTSDMLFGSIKVAFIDDGATDDSAQKIGEYVKKISTNSLVLPQRKWWPRFGY